MPSPAPSLSPVLNQRLIQINDHGITSSFATRPNTTTRLSSNASTLVLTSGGGPWAEGVKLASALGFKFPNITGTGLADLIPATAGSLGIALMGECLLYDPNRRPTAHEALSSAWFKDLIGSPLQTSAVRSSTLSQNKLEGTSTRPSTTAITSPTTFLIHNKQEIIPQSQSLSKHHRVKSTDSFDFFLESDDDPLTENTIRSTKHKFKAAAARESTSSIEDYPNISMKKKASDIQQISPPTSPMRTPSPMSVTSSALVQPHLVGYSPVSWPFRRADPLTQLTHLATPNALSSTSQDMPARIRSARGSVHGSKELGPITTLSQNNNNMDNSNIKTNQNISNNGSSSNSNHNNNININASSTSLSSPPSASPLLSSSLRKQYKPLPGIGGNAIGSNCSISSLEDLESAAIRRGVPSSSGAGGSVDLMSLPVLGRVRTHTQMHPGIITSRPSTTFNNKKNK